MTDNKEQEREKRVLDPQTIVLESYRVCRVWMKPALLSQQRKVSVTGFFFFKFLSLDGIIVLEMGLTCYLTDTGILTAVAC